MTNRALLDLDALPQLFRHQVAPATELIALGLAGADIEERCRDDGPWRRLRQGLVLLCDEPPTRPQQIQAALTVAGPEAVLSGVDALNLHGLKAAQLQGPVHVLMPPRRHSRLTDGAFFERTHLMPVPELRFGFPVAPLSRAMIDTCRRAKAAEHVRALLTEAIRRGRLTPAELRAELVRAGSRGTALCGRILAEIEDSAYAVTKNWANRLIQKAGLPTPQWRAPISGPTGAHLATPDVWWEEANLAWEITTYAFALPAPDLDGALVRASRLSAAGITVIHTSPTHLRDKPALVADLLREAYARAEHRKPAPALAA